MAQLVHISLFDNRGIMSYAIRVPFNRSFVESIKILIPETKREWKMILKVWAVDISEIKRLYKLLQVTFFEEEFCPFCWQKKACIEWQLDYPRTEGRLLPWPSEAAREEPPPPRRAPEAATPNNERREAKPEPVKKRPKKAPKPPVNPDEPPKPKKPRTSRKKRSEVPPVTESEPRSSYTESPKAAPPPRPSAAPPPQPRPTNPIEGLMAAEAILGIRYPYTADEIKAAFRKKSLIVHPDRPGGSTEAFIRLQDARDLLLKFKGGI